MNAFYPQDVSRIAFGLFQKIVWLYPALYRGRFQEEMIQTYRDMARDMGADASLSALSGLWTQVLPDLLASILREQLADYGGRAYSLAGAFTSIRCIASGKAPYRLRFPALARTTAICFALILLFTWAFCFWLGGFFLQKAVNSFCAIGEIFALFGLSTWLFRAWRFQRETNGFRAAVGATTNDTEYLTRSQRWWVLFIYENRVLIGLTLAGLLAVLLAVLYWEALTPIFPPKTVLHFLAQPGLPAYYFDP